MEFLESLLSDGFEETMGNMLGIEMEGRRPKYIGKGYGHIAPADHYKGYERGVIRYRPRHKGLANHTRSEHASHGIGSYCRTHRNGIGC